MVEFSTGGFGKLMVVGAQVWFVGSGSVFFAFH